MKNKILFLILLISALSTFGSLYFSEVVGFVPCTLCWYQRIFMYPVFILSSISLYKKDYGVFKYILVLSFIGALFASYHVLYEHGIVPHSKICGGGADCATKYFEYFGFITLPFLSLMSFLAIFVLSDTSRYAVKELSPNNKTQLNK